VDNDPKEHDNRDGNDLGDKFNVKRLITVVIVKGHPGNENA